MSEKNDSKFIDLSYLHTYVKALEEALEKAYKLEEEHTDKQSFVLELGKARGISALISEEGIIILSQLTTVITGSPLQLPSNIASAKVVTDKASDYDLPPLPKTPKDKSSN